MPGRLAGWRLAATLGAVLFAAPALAAESPTGPTPHYPLKHPHHVNWTFDGPFGKFDPQQVQRGFQLYREVCSSCHSLSLVAFRTLASETGPHFSEEQVRSLAAEFEVTDGPNDQGDMFQRPARPSDYFPKPFANEQAARAANGGAYPPDLSLMAKARAISSGFPGFIVDFFTQYQESGPDYIHALLNGYGEEPPAGIAIRDGQYYNPYFISGPALAMPPPLSDGQVTYAQNGDDDPGNDVPETVEQYSRDVTSFLMWTAEPHLVDRKSMGLTVFVFLIILAGLVYYTKKKVWAYMPGEGAT